MPTLLQNRVAERKHHHIIETARTLLLHANAFLKFWGDAILIAGLLINHIPSSILNNKVPHSILFPGNPLYTAPPQVFGSTNFVRDLFLSLDKLSTQVVKCISVGYSQF